MNCIDKKNADSADGPKISVFYVQDRQNKNYSRIANT
jgi:hypothetical protein